MSSSSRVRGIRLIALAILILSLTAWFLTRGKPEQESASSPPIRAWGAIEDFDQNLAVFETVFWDPRDTISLREWIRTQAAVPGSDVLEIGTGSGLLSLCCLQAGANSVIATDVNPNAIANAKYNSRQLLLQERLILRQVPLENSGAYQVLTPTEQFDLIISNPPWVNARANSIDEYALYDEHFELMQSLFRGLRKRLRPGGRMLLAYGCCDAIRQLEKLALEFDCDFRILDDRNLDDLDEEFLPGMLVEIRPRPIGGDGGKE